MGAHSCLSWSVIANGQDTGEASTTAEVDHFDERHGQILFAPLFSGEKES